MRLSDRFNSALIYASLVHRKQTRKGSGTPYLAHLMGVASIVLEHDGSEDEAIGALLHDAVEDQGGEARLAEIRSYFGEYIASIVEGCTDSYSEPKPPWQGRKQKYIDRMPLEPYSVLIVSAADKLYNASAVVRDIAMLGDVVWTRFAATPEQTLWYYRSLITAYRESREGRDNLQFATLVDELEAVVDKMADQVERRGAA